MPVTTDFDCCFLGYQGGNPILIIKDSISKALPSHKNWRHELLKGKTFTNVTDSIYNRTILIGGVRVVVIHMGTNSVDYRMWGRGGAGQWEQQLEAIKGEVSSLCRAICSFNATSFIIFSAVLPRKCDWQHWGPVQGVNSSLRPFVRLRIVASCQPTHPLCLRVVLARDAQWGTSLLSWTKGYISTCQGDISWQRGSGWAPSSFGSWSGLPNWSMCRLDR